MGQGPTTGRSEVSRRRVSLGAILGAGWYGVLLIVSGLVSASGEMDRGTMVMLLLAGLAPIAVFQGLAMSRAGAEGGSGRGRVLEQRMHELTCAMERMTSEAGLSEGAKRVLHRREERELLRRAIEQDIADQDWDAAMVLVRELAERFGYRSDAEEFRSRIERARAQTLDQRVVEALAELEELVRRRQWTEAYADAARIMRLYPDSHRVDRLRERIDQARMAVRRELEQRFRAAAEREQVDEAMELLRELDAYLTPAEAEPLRTLAAEVIAKSRENLGVRFKLMVQDHQWTEAVNAAERIMREFPNTRMAQEVLEMMPALREKAGAAEKR